jgi:hypothetical protein
MSRTRIPIWLRERVAETARYRCGYCLSCEAVVGAPMEIDHLIPEALGGLTEEVNLWLACSLCNDHKADRIAAPDPLSGEVVRLFNPRQQSWCDHSTGGPASDHSVTTPSFGERLSWFGPKSPGQLGI